MEEAKKPFIRKDFDYEDLSDGEMEESWTSTLGTKVKRFRRILIFVLSIIATAIAFGGLMWERKLERAHHRPEWGICGNSSAQARANGCILDFVPGAWVHPDCYDAQLEKEFLGLQPWKWYADENFTEELSFDYIRETGGPDPIWVTMEYHLTHCAYTWKKLHRAVILQIPIDTHVGAYKHTDHCAHAPILGDGPKRSPFNRIFTSCKMPEDCKSHFISD